MAYKGYFKPTNPQKYAGDPSNIVYRSRWELVVMSYLDRHEDVIKWASEEVIIPYVSPVDGRRHRYFPDFTVVSKTPDGRTKKTMIEVKPKSQTVPPAQPKQKTKRFIQEVTTWAVNDAKWKAARHFCEMNGWDFTILTEDDLNLFEHRRW
jgi:hypothetical protein